MTMSNPLQSAMLADAFHDFMFARRGSSARPFAAGTEGVDSIFMWIFWVSTAVFIPLMVIMVYWVFKYRRRPGTIALASTSHNTPLELAWSIIPMGFFAYMFFQGFHGYISRMASPADAIELQLTGRKWSWSIVYPNGAETPETMTVGSQPVPIFYVPEDRPVRIRMISQDVIHAFWIPDFRVKIDVQPNRYTSYWFKPEKLEAGQTSRDHFVFCAEYCGDLHSEMAAILRVVPDKEYAEVTNKWNDAVPPVDLGKRVWTSKCQSCHSVDGSKSTGPTWKGLYGHEVQFSDGTGYTGEQMTDDTFFANYIRESILTPAKKIVAGFPNQMTPFAGQISDKQIDGVIAYMKTLK